MSILLLTTEESPVSNTHEYPMELLEGVYQEEVYFYEHTAVLTIQATHQYFMEWLLKGAMQEEYFLESLQAAVSQTHEYPYESLLTITQEEVYFYESLVDILAITQTHKYPMEWLRGVTREEEFLLESLQKVADEEVYYIESVAGAFWVDEPNPAIPWSNESGPDKG